MLRTCASAIPYAYPTTTVRIVELLILTSFSIGLQKRIVAELLSELLLRLHGIPSFQPVHKLFIPYDTALLIVNCFFEA
jgi:hypothetical protein